MPRVRFVLAFLFLFSMFAGLVRTAQPVLAAESATLSGIEIQWGLPWGKAPQGPTSESTGESVSLAYGTARVVFAVSASTDMQEDQIELMLSVGSDESERGSHVIVDGNGSTYELGHFTVGDEVRGYFYLEHANASPVAQLFVAPIEEFGALFLSAQDVLSIDGSPVFEDVGAAGLADLLGSPSVQDAVVEEAAATTGERFVDPSTGYTVEWSAPWQESPDTTASGVFEIFNGEYLAEVGYKTIDTNGSSLLKSDPVFAAMFESALPNGGNLVGHAFGPFDLLYVFEMPSGYAVFECSVIPGSSEVLVTLFQLFSTDLGGAVSAYQEFVVVNGQTPLQSWGDVADQF
jgi:hypothetical protein